MARLNNIMARTTAGTRRLGILSNAKVFNGASVGYLSVGFSTSKTYTPTDSYTWECFFKTSARATQTLFGGLFKAGSTSAIAHGINTSGMLTPFYRDDNNVSEGTASTGHNAVDDNKWHHVVFMRDGANNKNYIFLDGVKVNGSGGNAYTPTGNIVLAVNPFIGCRNGRGTPDQYFKGLIDEVRISNIARYSTSGFTAINFNNRFVSDANTDLLLHMDEATTPLDSSSNNVTITVNGQVGNGEGYFITPNSL